MFKKDEDWQKLVDSMVDSTYASSSKIGNGLPGICHNLKVLGELLNEIRLELKASRD